jgi:hypothetical protein
LKYLGYLPDATPFGLVEVDVKKFVEEDGLISKQVYENNLKQIESRKKARQRKIKDEDNYNN